MATDLGWATNVQIGATEVGMADVKIEPVVEFGQGTTKRVVGGQSRVVGTQKCWWRYPNRRLTGAQFDQLKTLVDDSGSATVYIKIPTNNVAGSPELPVYATYSAVMHWPETGVERPMYNEWTFADGILFDNLVAA